MSSIDVRQLPLDSAVSVRAILTEDWVARKIKKWDLIPVTDFHKYITVIPESPEGVTPDNNTKTKKKPSSSKNKPIRNKKGNLISIVAPSSSPITSYDNNNNNSNNDPLPPSSDYITEYHREWKEKGRLFIADTKGLPYHRNTQDIEAQLFDNLYSFTDDRRNFKPVKDDEGTMRVIPGIGIANVENMIEKFYAVHYHLRTLLNKHYGKLAVCGGSLSRLLRSDINAPFPNNEDYNSPQNVHNVLKDSDCDLFFHSCSKEEATTILFDCLATISSSLSKHGMIRIEHKKYVTNVVLEWEDAYKNRDETIAAYEERMKERRKHNEDHGIYVDISGEGGNALNPKGRSYRYQIYQFVHRVYPTLGSIIGGFDLGPCMLAFDGRMIWGTTLGAWCTAKSALIVDVSRRSTSFEYRIRNYYNRCYGVVFPGITQDFIRKNFPTYDPDSTENNYYRRHHNNADNKDKLGRSYMDAEKKEEKISKVYKLLSSLGLKINRDMLDRDVSVGDVLEAVPKPDELRLTNLKINVYQTGVLNEARPSFNYVDKTPEVSMKKYSDYADATLWDENLDRANGSVLRNNNLECVTSHLTLNLHGHFMFNFNYDTVLELITNLINNPVVKVDQNYNMRVIKYLDSTWGTNEETEPRREISLFAEFVPEIRRYRHVRKYGQKIWKSILDYPKKRDPAYEDIFKDPTPETAKFLQDYHNYLERVTAIIAILTNRMYVNAHLMQLELKGIHWIEDDPQRQWTSSINPVMTNPRDFYKEWYTPFRIGIPEEIETTLRLIRKIPDHPFSKLNNDVFTKLILMLM